MKNLKILSIFMLGLLFTFYSCDEDDTVIPDVSCAELSFKQDGTKLIADYEKINDADIHEWFISDELVAQSQGSDTLDLSSLEPGTYEVCIKTETPSCPEGTSFCQQIVIEDAVAESCPDLAFTREGDYLLADFEGRDELDFYGWSITGEALGQETITENEGTQFEGDNKFDLKTLESGTYTICLVSESETCTLAEPFCLEIEVENTATGNDDCPELMYTREGDYLIANFEGIDELDFYGWRITGEVLGQETIIENEGTSFDGDNKFNLNTLQSGTYTICLISESQTCTLAAPFCQEIEVENTTTGGDNCPKVSFTTEGSLLLASFPGLNELDTYEWFVNGDLVETESLGSQDRDDVLDLSSYNPGTYTVCIKAKTADCANGVEYCSEVVVREPLNINCSSFKLVNFDNEAVAAETFAITDLDSNSVVWTIDGTEVEQLFAGVRILKLENYLTVSGKYQICYEATSPTCGTLQECMEVDFVAK